MDRLRTFVTLLLVGPWSAYGIYLAAYATGAIDLLSRLELKLLYGVWCWVFVVGSVAACVASVLAGRRRGTTDTPIGSGADPRPAGAHGRRGWDIVTTVAVYALVLWFWSPLAAAAIAPMMRAGVAPAATLVGMSAALGLALFATARRK